jgi:hypothetical protein
MEMPVGVHGGSVEGDVRSERFGRGAAVVGGGVRLLAYPEICVQSPPELGCVLSRVGFGTEQMNRDVRLLANHPTVVWLRRDVEQIAGSQLDDVSVVEGRRRRARHHQADVLDGATGRT